MHCFSELWNDIKRDSASLSSTYENDYASYAIDGDISLSGTRAHSMCNREGSQSLTINFKSRSCIKVRSISSNKIIYFGIMAGPSNPAMDLILYML